MGRWYDIPAGPAEKALKTFSIQSGVEILFATSTVMKAGTKAVKGNYSAGDALGRLLHATGMVAHAVAGGRFTILREQAGKLSEWLGEKSGVSPPPVASGR